MASDLKSTDGTAIRQARWNIAAAFGHCEVFRVGVELFSHRGHDIYS